jgi:hypothetical protein
MRCGGVGCPNGTTRRAEELTVGVRELCRRKGGTPPRTGWGQPTLSGGTLAIWTPCDEKSRFTGTAPLQAL